MIENFVEEFKKFVNSKPPDEYYKSSDPNTCALGQFVASLGYLGRCDGYVRPDYLDHEYPYPKNIRYKIHVGTFGNLAKAIEYVTK